MVIKPQSSPPYAPGVCVCVCVFGGMCVCAHMGVFYVKPDMITDLLLVQRSGSFMMNTYM